MTFRAASLSVRRRAAESWLLLARRQAQTASGKSWNPPNPPSKIVIPGVQHIVAVASGKGGVGKSTTTVNMAVSLSRTLGLRVGILDADVSGPSIGQMMGVSGKPAMDSEGLMIPPEAYGVKCMSTALLLPPTGAAFWRGPMVMSALETMMRSVAWRPLDVLLVDMPPGTGDAQLTVCQRLHLTGAVIVSTPQEVALQDARRGVSAFAAARVPVLGMVQNMSLHVCERCGHESHIFGGGGVQEAAESAGVPLLGDVPLQMDVRESGDAGAPVAASEADSPAVRAYRGMAKKVWEGCTAKH